MYDELLFKILFIALLIVFAFIRTYYYLKAVSSDKKVSVRERLKEAVAYEGKFLVMSQYVSAVLWYVAIASYIVDLPWTVWYPLQFTAWLRWIGVGLGIISLPLLTWVHHALGEQFSTRLKLRENHKLVTRGPYGRVRHPMYTSFFMFLIGTALVSSNLPMVLISIVNSGLMYARIGKEEQMMIKRFGNDYRSYMKRTGRILPSLHLKAGKKTR